MIVSFKYRQFVTIFLALFVWGDVSLANTIDTSTAKIASISYLNIVANKNLSVQNLRLEYSELDTDNTPLIYVFSTSENNGFVITSALYDTYPILGYSLGGKFIPEKMPDEYRVWLDNYKRQIQFLRRSRQINQKANSKWDDLISSSSNNNNSTNASLYIPPLTNVTWGQDDPYNSMCPQNNLFNKCLTGCVATAMAQIMKKWNHPITGTGSTSYTNQSNILSANFASTTYNWHDMPNHLTGDNNDVALLMSHCGISVHMNYCLKGRNSGAWTISTEDPNNSAEVAYSNYFKYNSSTIKSIERNLFPYNNDSIWINTLINELQLNRPVQYVGLDSNSRELSTHSWVCEGYSGYMGDYFYMNWGWNGLFNSWFLLNSLIDSDNLFNYSQSYYQKAIIGIQPICEIADLLVSNISANNYNVTVGNSFNINFKEINSGNLSVSQHKIKYYLSATRNLTNSSIPLGEYIISGIPSLGETPLVTISATVPAVLNPGEYWIVIKADSDNNVEECYENNNTSSFKINIINPACQQPVNDECTGPYSAIDLSSGTSCIQISGTTCGATNSDFPVCGSTNSDDDVFYKFVALSTGATVKVNSSYQFDAVFQVLSGNCGTSMQAVGPTCVNLHGTGQGEEYNYTGLIQGATYFIRVWHAGGGWGSGNFSICVQNNFCNTINQASGLMPGNSNYPGEVINTTTPTFSWNNALGATTYVINISKEPFGFNNIIYTSTCTSSYFTIPAGILTNGNIYRWDIKALASCESQCYSFSNDFYFTVSAGTCNSPTLQASEINVVGNSAGSVNLTWINGSGNRRIVKINTINVFSSPIDGSNPAANTIYAGTGEQVIYNGTGSDVLVSGLQANTNYCFRVYEASCSGSSIKFNSSIANNNPSCLTTSGSTCSTPGIQSSNIIFQNIGTNSISLNWTRGNGYKRIVKINTTSSFSNPQNGIDPVANSIYNGTGEQVVYNGTGNTITISGLASNTNYCFKVFEANCSGPNIMYNTGSTDNFACTVTEANCNAPLTPLPLVGNSNCPGISIDRDSVILKWTKIQNTKYDIEIREYPFGITNVIYSQFCISDTLRFIPSSLMESGKLYGWRVRSTSDCNSCKSIWSSLANFHTIPELSPEGSLYLCNATGINLSTSEIQIAAPATISYQWYKLEDSGVPVPVGNNTSTYFVSSSGIYYVRLTYAGMAGCPAPYLSLPSRFDSIYIGSTPPSPTLSGNSPVTVGSAINLKAETNVSGNNIFFWSGPNGFAAYGDNPTIPSSSLNNSGIYKCYLVNNNCHSEQDSINILVIPNLHSAFRYWADLNFERAIYEDVGIGSDINISRLINASGISDGLHTFNIQFFSSGGIWSSVVSGFFYKPVFIPQSSSEYEIWFDNNFQTRISGQISPTDNYFLLSNIDITLPEGLHSLNLRFKLNGKTWSIITTDFFVKNTQSSGLITKYQYWYDSDFAGAIINNVTPVNFLNVNNYFSLNNIPTGLHTLNFRTGTENNKWSGVINSFIYKINPQQITDNKIIKYKYWFNNQTSDTNVVTLSTPLNDYILLNSVCSHPLNLGLNEIHFQFLDSLKVWSSVLSDTFNYVAPIRPIISLSGPSTICSNASVTLTSSTGTAYLWNNGATTQSISVSTAGNYYVTVYNGNNCGITSDTITISVLPIPNQPGPISGLSECCSGSTQVYSITPVITATSYTWTLPSGWTGSSTANSITVTTGATGGNIIVRANNSCGSSPGRSLPVTSNNPPGQPGAITGNITVCQGSVQTYAVSAVSGATGYSWTLPAGWIGTSNTNSISVTAGASGGNILVRANNTCGSSIDQSLSVTVNSTPVQPGAITGNTSVCQASSQTYSIAVVPGATSYTWSLPVGWLGTSSTNTISITAGTAGGNILVRANNSCGNSPDQTLAVAVIAAPGQPGTITGNNAVCQGSSQTYSIVSVPGATSYTWTLPSGWTGSSSTNTITVTSGNTGGSILVKANNSCGSSADQTLSVTVNSIPNQPGPISGNSTVCQGTNQTYSVTAVAGASSYTWTLPASWSGSSSTNSISVTAGSTGGNIQVKANNSCGSSIDQLLSITVNNIPSQPGPITGSNSVCQGSTQTYSVAAVSGATGYTWTLPAGWTGTSTTNSISVTTGSTGGNILVKANNNCGSSADQSLTITVLSSPSQPGTITGNISVCQGSAQTYSVIAVSGATSYTWILPAGWSGTSNTNSISATAGNTGGTILVKANNTCGSSPDQSLSIAAIASPSQPGLITGSSTVTIGQSTDYSIAAVPGATNYNWILVTGGNIQSGQNTSSVSVNWTVLGTHTLSVNASNSCGNSTNRDLSITVSPVTGITNPNNDFQIQVMPNPTEGVFYLKATGVINKNIVVEILSASGQSVLTFSEKAMVNNYVRSIDLSKFSAGVYFIKMRVNKTDYLRIITKQ